MSPDDHSTGWERGWDGHERAQRERLARAGARRAQEEFTWERRAEGLLSLYRALGVRWTSPLVMSPTPRSGGAPRLLGEGTP